MDDDDDKNDDDDIDDYDGMIYYFLNSINIMTFRKKYIYKCCRLNGCNILNFVQLFQLDNCTICS